MIFRCSIFLWDRWSWDREQWHQLRFVDDWSRDKAYEGRVNEMLEEIRALEFRGFQFEPPSEEEWNAFCDRVQGRSIFDDVDL